MTLTAPNFTQIPNAIIDKMHLMSPAEFKVLMAICRKTFGWQKSHDVISLSQLERLTGLSRTAVHHGITAGIERGMLEQTKLTTQVFSYRLLVVSDYQSTQTTSNDDGSEPVVSGYQSVASDYQSPQTTSSLSGPPLVVSVDQQLVVSDYSQKKGLNKLKETPPPPQHRARQDVGFGGGGGDERMETDDEGNSPHDSQWEEAEAANVKADLVDALAALGVRPEMAKRAVDTKTVTSDRDVILCKRFIQSSTAHTPAAVLWLQYLSVGRLPPAPYSDTSTVSEAQIAAARRLADEADARSPEPDQYVGSRAMAAALAGSPLKHIARAPLAFPGRTAP